MACLFTSRNISNRKQFAASCLQNAFSSSDSMSFCSRLRGLSFELSRRRSTLMASVELSPSTTCASTAEQLDLLAD